MAQSWKWLVAGLTLIFLAQVPAWGRSLPEREIPDPLKPWISWSLHGQEEAFCPSPFHAPGEHWCRWPGELNIKVDEQGGSFRQTWELFAPGRVLLPVAERFWPQDVRVDGQPAVVTFQEGGPSVFLGEGKHSLEGHFVWKRLPDSLFIPSSTALVTLTVEGKRESPRIEKDGRLWLRNDKGVEASLEDRLQIQVFRKLSDDIPAVLTTRLILDVSGRSRELLLGRILPSLFLPASLKSPLPLRVETDGRLRLQVRPGRWELEVEARHQGPLTRLSIETVGASWPPEEVWSFEARPHLRLVAVEGLTPIDPQQTNLPLDWASLPAFLFRPGETLVIKEKRRGDPEPAPDRLSLQRNLWLDFDGKGYTVQDRINGTMTRGWRLETRSFLDLGRVSIDGEDRFITRLADASGAGVEVRRGRLEMVADSRMKRTGSEMPATGWNQDFVQVQSMLNLPPGWRLLHAVGADSVPGTWITQWSLFDLFLVLLVSLAAGRLWGWPWGFLALVSLALSYHEPGAPRWVWLHLLAAVALIRVLPAGKVRTLAGLYRLAALVALLVFFLPFAVNQIRSGIFPQLELRYGGAQLASRGMTAARPAEPVRSKGREVLLQSVDAVAERMEALPSSGTAKVKESQERLPLHDPNALVQTGPGLPQWQWRSIPIRWNGPVKPSQTLKLFFLPPAANLFLGFLRVALLGGLVLLFLDRSSAKTGRWRLTPRAGWIPLLVLGICAWPSAARAEIPGPEILGQLRERLLAPADCFPRCAEIQGIDALLSSERLALSLDVHAEARVAIPLPGQRGQWLPERVRMDDRPASLYLGPDGRSWLVVTPGRHRVALEGPLPDSESVILPLPLPPRRIDVSGQGWELAGADGTWPPAQMRFRRLAGKGEKPLAVPRSPDPPSYFRVERTLSLGLRWQVRTRVVRLFKGGGPAAITVPLLDGEAVTSEGISSTDGRVTLNIPAGTDQAGWESVLDIVPRLRLQAVSSENWNESWKLDASPIWHVKWKGIPVVHHQDSAGNWLPEWRPWPTEVVELVVSRPEGLAGRTLTVDDSLLTVKPGRRSTETGLKLRLRSSQGGHHVLTLPAGADLQRVAIDGRSQPIRQEGRAVTLPLTPGKKEIEMSWMTEGESGFVLRTPEVDLGAPGVNARIRLEMPRDRWVLFAGGPRLGPAVLFWGVLLVLIPMAYGLGKSSLTPLRFRHWFLLGIGLTQLEPVQALVVVGWLLALGARGRLVFKDKDWVFNGMQIGLAILTGYALLSLLVSVQQGLLGYPHMQIAGNGSSSAHLLWYQDRAAGILPRAWLVSVPLMLYRLLMLSWALWLAMSLLGWLQWGWKAFSLGGLWRPLHLRRKSPEKEKHLD